MFALLVEPYVMIQVSVLLQPHRTVVANFDSGSGVARLCAGPDHKITTLSTPQICLKEFELKEVHVSCLCKI